MSKLANIFTQTKMSWKRVLILSVICGVIPGLLMLPECLAGTSLQNPGISYEFWIFAALYIILNCGKPLEAGLKTFVFFLISQPLIYLVQVPFSRLGWQLFNYYPIWGLITLFTFPGGMIAWYTKKGGLLGVLILSAANAILCMEVPEFVRIMIDTFPKFILSLVFIIFELVFFAVVLFKNKKDKILAYGIIAVMLCGFSVRLINMEMDKTNSYGTNLQGTPPFEIVSEIDGLNIRTNDNMLFVDTAEEGEFSIVVKDALGNEQTVRVSIENENAEWSE